MSLPSARVPLGKRSVCICVHCNPTRGAGQPIVLVVVHQVSRCCEAPQAPAQLPRRHDLACLRPRTMLTEAGSSTLVHWARVHDLQILAQCVLSGQNYEQTKPRTSAGYTSEVTLQVTGSSSSGYGVRRTLGLELSRASPRLGVYPDPVLCSHLPTLAVLQILHLACTSACLLRCLQCSSY